MAKITLPTITTNYVSVAQLNNAFQLIEDALNDAVLYRDNPGVETNTMENDLDMNSYKLLNVGEITVSGPTVTTASQVGIVDVADNTLTDNVEDALAEIYTSISTNTTNITNNASQSTINASNISELQDRNNVTALSSSSSVVTLDYDDGDYFTLTLTENITSWTITNLPGSGRGATMAIEITQDGGGGGYTVALPTGGSLKGGNADAMPTGDGDVALLFITTFDNGTSYQCTWAVDYA